MYVAKLKTQKLEKKMRWSSIFRRLYPALGVSLLLTQFAPSAQAASIRLAWDNSSDARTAGYQLNYGTSMGRYSHQIDVGNKTGVEVTNLEDGVLYYFAVTGYTDSKSQWSRFSNEVSYRIPKAQAASSASSSPAASARPKANSATGSSVYGGTGGTEFADTPADFQSMSGVRVNKGWALDGIRTYMNTGEGSAHGGSGGSGVDIWFEAGEHLVGISGRYHNFVNEISFITSKGRVIGPYGKGLDPDGTPATASFKLNAASGNEIIGFSGKESRFVNAIGIVQRPLQNGPASAPAATQRTTPATAPAPVAQAAKASTDPAGTILGGPGGTTFQDRLRASARLTQIDVRCGWAIDAIQAMGTAGSLGIHGGGGGSVKSVTFAEGEYLVGVRGRYGNYVNEISFETNTGRTIGPFGEARDPDGTPAFGDFSFEADSGNEITGFTGRAGQFVDAIGVTQRPH